VAEVVLVDGPEEAGALVADHVAALVATSPTTVLGVATGSTPLPVYRALAGHAAAGTDFSQVRAFALDEYVGLPPDHPQRYAAVVEREFTTRVGADPRRVHVPDGSLDGIETAGTRYEDLLVAAGGVDLQLLGIGRTGHVGFNEPGSSFGSLTRVKTLTDRTRHDNARFFESVDDVPVHCVTQGLGTIRRARHLVLLAFGANKATALAAAVEGPLTSSMPASVIQLHPHVTVVVDPAAAGELVHLDYHRRAQRLKPGWQGL
jgi:glucosamine-6-phosphate deaminase